jgi:hypothetical protein
LVTINGTYAGVNVSFLLSDDGTNYYPVTAVRTDCTGIETTSGVLPANTSRAWQVNVGVAANLQVLATSWTSGTANVRISPIGQNTFDGVTVQGLGTFAVSPAVGSGWILYDLASFVAGTTQFTPIGGFFNDSVAALTTGEVGVSRMTAYRATHVNLRNNSGGELTTFTVAPTGTQTVAFSSGTGTVTSNAGTGSRTVVFSSGTGTVSANAGTGTFTVVGNVAAAAADSGSPVKIGAVAQQALPTAATTGQRQNVMCDKLGRVSVGFQPRELVVQNQITLTTTTETTLIAAAGAAVFVDLVSIYILDTGANGIRVSLRDSTAGTIRWVLGAPQNASNQQGFTSHVWQVPLTQATANNNWTAQLSVAPTGSGSVYISVVGIKNS